MFVVTDAEQWARENFGSSDLGDKRRSARLVRMAGDLARHVGSSLLKACDGDEAAAEGMYRLLHNDEVDPGAIELRANHEQLTFPGALHEEPRNARGGEYLSSKTAHVLSRTQSGPATV